jgi:short-subunit dehydrogenase
MRIPNMSWTESISDLRRGARRTVNRRSKAGFALGTGLAVGAALATVAYRRRNRFDLAGRVVVITGGSRGLGYALAQECSRLRANVAICARDGEELRVAKESIQSWYHVDVHTQVCDVGNKDDAEEFISAVLSRYGQIDVLINNAGVITVAPMESQSLTDYQEAMDTMFWGVVYPTLAVLPHLKQKRSGRIANITSIGGKIAVPHLLPYCSAKFAAVGFSEGLRAELLKSGIKVTTVCPGLMRTGSHLNAYFKGQHRKEFTLFSFGATLPLVSINARRAARKIIDAIQNGRAELIITPQAKIAAIFHGVFPGLTADILGVVDRMLPKSSGDTDQRHLGRESQNALTRSPLQKAGHDAAREFNQNVRTI